MRWPPRAAAAVRGTASARCVRGSRSRRSASGCAPRAPPVRLAPREGEPARRSTARSSSRCARRRRRARGSTAVLRAKDGASVAATVDALAPGCRALAALLAQLGQRPHARRWRGIRWPRSLRVLCARADGLRRTRAVGRRGVRRLSRGARARACSGSGATRSRRWSGWWRDGAAGLHGARRARRARARAHRSRGGAGAVAARHPVRAARRERAAAGGRGAVPGD